MASKKAVIGLVASYPMAERVVGELQRAGFGNNDISALFPDKQGTRDFAHETNTKAPEGAITGVVAGGAVGGTLGLLVGMGAIFIPGLGPVLAAGPIMAALSGAAAGATLGGVTGALVGLGFPEVEAKVYEGKVKGGNILISVHADNDEMQARAKDIFERNDVTDIATTGEATVPRGERPSYTHF